MFIRLNSLRLSATTLSEGAHKPDLIRSKVVDIGTLETSTEFARYCIHDVNDKKYLVVTAMGQEILAFLINPAWTGGKVEEKDLQLVWRFIELEAL